MSVFQGLFNGHQWLRGSGGRSVHLQFSGCAEEVGLLKICQGVKSQEEVNLFHEKAHGRVKIIFLIHKKNLDCSTQEQNFAILLLRMISVHPTTPFKSPVRKKVTVSVHQCSITNKPHHNENQPNLDVSKMWRCRTTLWWDLTQNSSREREPQLSPGRQPTTKMKRPAMPKSFRFWPTAQKPPPDQLQILQSPKRRANILLQSSKRLTKVLLQNPKRVNIVP